MGIICDSGGSAAGRGGRGGSPQGARSNLLILRSAAPATLVSFLFNNRSGAIGAAAEGAIVCSVRGQMASRGAPPRSMRYLAFSAALHCNGLLY
ncbi:hypothetical protein EVAR_66443_1 [Eumeta japonica]|uniref:Uncharacterized protein n=1 Tax=Eumeta variegata TaxID=151549 RepID=A0A4C2A2S9_EUMVA|nr:hypothetical protein EVAR_66443_1 [Eumeta japonica]